MQFTSVEFLFYYLPLFMAVYLIFPARCRPAILAAGSFVYYAFACDGDYWWLAVLAAVTLGTYAAGLTLRRRNGALLTLYLVMVFGTLAFFKVYAGGDLLPAGMSFYLFQAAAYLIDVYRRRLRPERNFLCYAAQTAMFPKLLSGPLVVPKYLSLQTKFCNPSLQNIHDGLQELIAGLALKVLLANRIGGLWTQAEALGYENISTPFAWMALAAYAMQLYFDFWGYSLMAMGLGHMVGYDLPRNFDDPYAAKTVSEFYRRWHITLGAWFRDYIYIPLGGSRAGAVRTIVNLAIVWILTGLWHGVGGNYLLWAMFLLMLIVVEKLCLGRILRRSHVLSHVYLIAAILLSWVPFAIGDMAQMLTFLGRLFGQGGILDMQDFILWGQSYAALLLAGLLLATPLPRRLWERFRHTVVFDILLTALFWVAVYFLSTAQQDPFQYFQF